MVNQYSTPLQLFVARLGHTAFLFEPDAGGGLSSLAPGETIVNCSYASQHETDDRSLRQKTQDLGSGRTFLWLRECTDGPPYRTAVLFRKDTDGHLPNRQIILSGVSVQLEGYLAATARGHQFSWANDLLTGHQGYFVSGYLNSPELWRVIRVDTDIAQRFLFTVAPVRLANGLPALRSDRIPDALLRAEADTNWLGLQTALTTLQFKSAITCAKNVAEAVLAHVVPAPQNSSGRRTLDKILNQLRAMIESGQNTTSLDTLDYHLLHLLRELHARTHPERASSEGRSVGPALAVSVAPALTRTLASLKLVD